MPQLGAGTFEGSLVQRCRQSAMKWLQKGSKALSAAASLPMPEAVGVAAWSRSLTSKMLPKKDGQPTAHKVLVAIANKHARQLWAMLAHGERYDAEAWLKHPMVHRQVRRPKASNE